MMLRTIRYIRSCVGCCLKATHRSNDRYKKEITGNRVHNLFSEDCLCRSYILHHAGGTAYINFVQGLEEQYRIGYRPGKRMGLLTIGLRKREILHAACNKAANYRSLETEPGLQTVDTYARQELVTVDCWSHGYISKAKAVDC